MDLHLGANRHLKQLKRKKIENIGIKDDMI